jgi:hypothetical protein
MARISLIYAKKYGNSQLIEELPLGRQGGGILPAISRIIIRQ